LKLRAIFERLFEAAKQAAGSGINATVFNLRVQKGAFSDLLGQL